jgi:putative ABC transport system ATP-binding protein
MDLLCKASCHYQQTVLMITHNMNLTLSADRVFQVTDGELEELGNVGKGASPL